MKLPENVTHEITNWVKQQYAARIVPLSVRTLEDMKRIQQHQQDLQIPIPKMYTLQEESDFLKKHNIYNFFIPFMERSIYTPGYMNIVESWDVDDPKAGGTYWGIYGFIKENYQKKFELKDLTLQEAIDKTKIFLKKAMGYVESFSKTPGDELSRKAKQDSSGATIEYKKTFTFYDSKITVILHDKNSLSTGLGRPSENAGYYEPGKRKLHIALFNQYPEDIREYQATLYNIIQTTVHEMKHAKQEIITHNMGRKTLLYPEFGMPPKDVRTPYSRQHDLRDVEFQTVLGDAIQEFKNRNIDNSQLINSIKQFVGLTDKEPHSFFKRLKENNPGKWKVAIKYLMNEVT